MTNITEQSIFSNNVRMYDTSDPVLGGLTGESNDPIIALTNRTKWLFDHVDFADVVSLNANTTITNAYRYKLIRAATNNNITLQVDDIANFTKGALLSFVAKTSVIKTITILPFTGQTFNLGSVALDKMYIYNGEKFQIVSTPNGWEILIEPSGFKLSGEDDLVRRTPLNSVVADGCTTLGSLPLRSDYARMWDAANAAGNIVSELAWFSDPYRYRAFFSSGDNATTFRWPDLRGITPMALDLSRGVSYERQDLVVGGYEADQVGQLTVEILKGDGYTGHSPSVNRMAPGQAGNIQPTDNIVVNKDKVNRVKTFGKIPIIYL